MPVQRVTRLEVATSPAVRLPVLLARGSDPGKRLVVTAGVHGDEYEGVRTIFDVYGKIDPAKLNVNGGAIALGHPVGATGSRIVLTLLLEMRRRSAKLGIASLCVGGGQGAAILLERN